MLRITPEDFVFAGRTARYAVGSKAILRALAGLDTLIITAAALLSRVLYEHAAVVVYDDLAMGLLVAALFVSIGRSQGLYRLGVVTAPSRHSRKIFIVISFSVLTVVLIFFLLKTASDHSRGVVALFYALATLSVGAGRVVAGAALRRGIEAGTVTGKPVVVIGESAECSGVSRQDLLNFGVNEVARYQLFGQDGGLADADRAKVRAAMETARELRAEEIALLISWSRETALNEALALLRECPLTVRLFPDRRTRDILQQHRGNFISPHLAVEVQREPLRRGERIAKRAFDIAVAAVGLAFLSPFFALTAILIKLDSRGPVIFRQRRRGFDKGVFTIYKFRTMTVIEDGERVTQAARNDARVTRVGRLLRRTSIDELPQLANVLIGDMSLIGPRPHAVAHDLEYSVKISEYLRRHHVKPGLTGAAQVRGYRGETRTLKQMADRVEWDLWYINNYSFLLDVRILLLTFFSLVRHEAF